MAGPVTVSQSNPKLLTRLRSKLRVGHYSLRTEQAYVRLDAAIRTTPSPYTSGAAG